MKMRLLVPRHVSWGLFLTGFCLLLPSLVCGQFTILDEGFETYTGAVADLADESDADPAGGQWLTVIDDDPLGAAAGSGVQLVDWSAHSGSQALLLRSSSELVVQLPDSRSGPSYQLDFWLQAKKGTGDRNFYLIVRAQGADTNGEDFLAYRSDRAATPSIFWWDGIEPATGWTDTGADHAENGGGVAEFGIVTIAQVAEGIQLTWESAGGDTYRVYRGTDLTSPASFTDISGPLAATSFVDTAPLAGAAFYRVEVEGAGSGWQHHRFVIDMATQTFDMYLDDMTTPFGTGLALSRAQAPVPCAIRIVHEGNSADDGYFLIDDIALTVTGSADLNVPFDEGFEAYAAAAGLPNDGDFDPAGPWITNEASGTGSAASVTPTRVQVVSTVAHTGANSLKLEGGQRTGVSFGWGTADKPDVEITWWARVPTSVPGMESNYLRMSLYCAEGGRTDQGDCALLGYGARNATIGDATALTIYDGGGWIDTGFDYTPDTWEKYKLVTHMELGKYSIIKDPDGAAILLADRRSMIGSAATYANAFIVGWSSSNGTGHPPVYIDDIEIKAVTSDVEPPESPYSATIDGGRFSTYTMVDIGATAGDAVVDPADNATIYFLVDAAAASMGGLWRMNKTGPGEWVVDPTPLVSSLESPSGLTIDKAGNLWWVHDLAGDVMRLKAPFGSSPAEIVIDQFQTEADDDPIAICVTPPGFSGPPGMPGWLAIADAGADDDALNAVLLLDPSATEVGIVGYANFLVYPSVFDLGGASLNGIAALPASNEVVTLSDDGFIFAIDASGGIREIIPVSDPFRNAEAITVDPIGGRLWAADDNLDQILSIDPQTGEDQVEISFFMEGETRPDYNINFHNPDLAFSPDGSFLVVADTDSRNGGGRFFIFHNEE